jgi:hypothetical protein
LRYNTDASQRVQAIERKGQMDYDPGRRKEQGCAWNALLRISDMLQRGRGSVADSDCR